MATKKQKQELIDVLKFTPIKVTLTIQGYGGECYAGKVDRKIYDYFKENKIDIEEYASSWDGFDDIPDEMRPFSCGSAYDCDNLFHASGAELSNLNDICISDESGNTVWEHNLGYSELEESGVSVNEIGGGELLDLCDENDVVFWGGQGEKGCFFDAEFILKSPFDPKKLSISYENCDDWYIVTGVEYDGEELDGFGGYSTTGKWAENKWVLLNGEEVYTDIISREDQEEDEDDTDEDDEDKSYYSDLSDESSPEEEFDPAKELDKIWEDAKTDWFDVSIKPERKGEYECEFESTTWPFPIERMCKWTGRAWKENGEKAVGVKRWRGLNFDPNEV